MDTTTELFIRACKSRHPLTRLVSVYNRYYYKGAEDPSPHIACILMKICEDFDLIRPSKLMDELNPDNNWRQVEEADKDNYHKRCVAVLMNAIRFTENSKLPITRTPAFVRNRYQHEGKSELPENAVPAT